MSSTSTVAATTNDSVDITIKNPVDYANELKRYYSGRPVYSYQEVVSASTKYFNGDILAGQKFADKYALKDPKRGFLELTPDDMHVRMAREFARAQYHKYENPSDRMSFDEIYDLMKDFKYIVPQGSPMYGIGNPFQYISVSNCFVVESPVDSYGGIMSTDQQLAQISKRRGGVGVDISTLRPSNTRVQNAAHTTTGAISFGKRFSNTIREVGQNGRRGALMLTMDIHHPDVMSFITVKEDLTQVTGANMSVRLSDEFLEAVERDDTYELRFWNQGKYANVYDNVSATDTWNKIIEMAWGMAEPGILFWDNILRESPADCYAGYGFRTICTNPCAEIAMSANDACRLLLQNLFSYVQNPFTPEARFDYDLFFKHTKIAQRLLDDLVDIEADCIQRIIHKIETDPEPEEVKISELNLWKKILHVNLAGRRTGNGVTAVGDVIAALDLKYDSDEGIAEIESIYRNLKHAAYESSIEMAEILEPFSCWSAELEKDNAFLLRIRDENPKLWERMQKSGRRNIALLTTAPTGTVSIMTQTSGGIEPEYSIIPYVRRTKGNPGDYGFREDFVDQNGDSWMNFLVVKPKLVDWFKTVSNVGMVKEIIQELEDVLDSPETSHSLEDLLMNCDLFSIQKEVVEKYPEKKQTAILMAIFDTITKRSPWYGSCAPDLDWKNRVELQGKAQRHVDHAISSTVNIPNSATQEDVKEIYMAAWKNGCKGMTVYRDGCRTGVLVGLESPEEEETKIHYNDAPKRPKEIDADVYHITYKKEPYFVFVGLIDENEPYEVFAGKNGFVPKSVKKAKIRKMKKGVYQAELDNGDIIENIGNHITDDQATITRMISLSLRHGAGIKHCVETLHKVEGDMTNFGRMLARALKKYIPDGTDASSLGDGEGTYVYQEGCVVRLEDGWTKCM